MLDDLIDGSRYGGDRNRLAHRHERFLDGRKGRSRILPMIWREIRRHKGLFACTACCTGMVFTAAAWGVLTVLLRLAQALSDLETMKKTGGWFASILGGS